MHRQLAHLYIVNTHYNDIHYYYNDIHYYYNDIHYFNNPEHFTNPTTFWSQTFRISEGLLYNQVKY